MRSRLQNLEAKLDGAIDFEKLDLGYTDKDLYGEPCAAYDPKKEREKKRYPSLHISRYTGDPFDFPDDGEASVKFKVVSRETNNRDGKKRNNLTLEIQSIDTGKKEKSGKKQDLSRRGRLINLEARLDDAIEFTDPRPRNQQGMFANTSEAGADPNTMEKAYGSQSRVSRNVLRKLRRKLPRPAVDQSL